jgi:hypothetical protein
MESSMNTTTGQAPTNKGLSLNNFEKPIDVREAARFLAWQSNFLFQ